MRGGNFENIQNEDFVFNIFMKGRSLDTLFSLSNLAFLKKMKKNLIVVDII